MEQEVITFKQAFQALNKIGNESLFDFDGEKIIPLNNRIKLVLIDSLLGPSSKFSSSELLKIPKKELMDNLRSNFEQHLSKSFVFVYYDPHIPTITKKAVKDFKNRFDDATIYIQGPVPSESLTMGKNVSTEELGELICALYFREKGYIVQKPLGTTGKEGKNKPGVDDVAAWKSPVIDELRRFGFIDKGCHISELACLRWLGKVSSSSRDFNNHTTKEVLLVEAEPSTSRGISNSPSTGINQLLRAKKEKVAKKLFICFPSINANIEEIFAEIKSRTREEPAVGAILFDDKGVYVQDSEVFPDENMLSAIEEYENNLKSVLLNNFYFDEILEMLKELNVDTKNKGINEVLIEFYNKIDQISIDYLLEKINRLVK